MRRSTGVSRSRMPAGMSRPASSSADVVRRLAQIVAALQGDECERARRADGDAARQTRVRVEPGRNVESEDRQSHAIDMLDAGSVCAVHRPVNPGAEQGVDDEFRPIEFIHNERGRPPAVGAKFREPPRGLAAKASGP